MPKDPGNNRRFSSLAYPAPVPWLEPLSHGSPCLQAFGFSSLKLATLSTPGPQQAPSLARNLIHPRPVASHTLCPVARPAPRPAARRRQSIVTHLKNVFAGKKSFSLDSCLAKCDRYTAIAPARLLCSEEVAEKCLGFIHGHGRAAMLCHIIFHKVPAAIGVH